MSNCAIVGAPLESTTTQCGRPRTFPKTPNPAGTFPEVQHTLVFLVYGSTGLLL